MGKRLVGRLQGHEITFRAPRIPDAAQPRQPGAENRWLVQRGPGQAWLALADLVYSHRRQDTA